MRPGTLLRLALLGGRLDLLRMTLTALATALATVTVLAAVTVLSLPVGPDRVSPQYSSPFVAEEGLRGGTALVLFLLTVPMLVLAAQSTRLGGPRRDRRLATLRLGGAGPRQVAAVAAVETVTVIAAGTVVGLGCYLAGRWIAHRPDPVTGTLPLPTDALPPATAILAVCLGVPLVAAVVSVLRLWRTIRTPLGVVRRAGSRRPSWWPVLLILVGVGLVALMSRLSSWLGFPPPGAPVGLLLAVVGTLSAAVGLVFGVGLLSYTAGRLLHRLGRGPAQLLAARRLLADPWSNSRAHATLLVLVLLAAIVTGWWALDRAELAVRAATTAGPLPHYVVPESDPFRDNARTLLYAVLLIAAVVAAMGMLVTLVESIVSRRRADSTMAAAGVPRRTMAAAVAWQHLASLVPGVVLAMGVGLALVRIAFGQVYVIVQPACLLCEPGFVTHPVPWPLVELAAIGGVALAAGVAVVGVGLVLVRSGVVTEELRVT